MTGGPPRHPGQTRERIDHLADFRMSPRVLLITALAIPIGAAGAGAAFCLIKLIGLITHLVFYQRVAFGLIAPGQIHHSPALILLAPIGGGLIIGLMARFGSERIRGHGMPEALEAILVRGSRVEPKVAVLKPISAAISIGTGGPFGAEGPIIMTGGAVGSVIAQTLHVTTAERKALMVSGAAAGMAATFNAPLASVLLAVELLLFELRPRSLAPVVAAVVTATIVRWPLLGHAPLFAMSLAHLHLTTGDLLLCVPAGAVGGLLAIGATRLIYASEDLFARLPIHWMWWPAIGGLIIGIGGLIEPRALGVGYDVIDELLTGRAGLSLIIGILVVKTLIWGLSLGSGTSAGVLAPTFMIGAALGGLEGHALPGVTPGFWAVVGLAAVVGGVMRSPLTGVVFPMELTQAWPLLMALLIASVAGHLISTLLLKRSVLTEKIARRGLHVSREYATDPLEALLVDEVMHLDQPGPPAEPAANGTPVPAPAIRAFPDETLRELAQRFAEHQTTSALVVSREQPDRTLGRVGVEDLLQAHLRELQFDHDRERVLRPPWRGTGRSSSVGSEPDTRAAEVERVEDPVDV